ncbi:hypothetical protein RI138_31660 [Streptomyces sp. C11-1]|uniref:RamC N-terminal domain-containing protein n=1 Tax=Streptomyces durocortorensis TaxID=2811104 RepID=A0ABY9W4F8_9ACTN|nr:hypothetical protein [Streptomyces durocortorensis]WNF31032.1 hypothetical protein RI138_31660 [Streptomyces durocortorensis]
MAQGQRVQDDRSLQELETAPTEAADPSILSGPRWGAWPVHPRYGSFTLRHCYDEHGELVPEIRAPDGRFIPGWREPAFRRPEWLELPDFLEPHWWGLPPRNRGVNCSERGGRSA